MDLGSKLSIRRRFYGNKDIEMLLGVSPSFHNTKYIKKLLVKPYCLITLLSKA